ncbi:MAG: BamA/TamA family outer membrane protein [Chitinophagaceae bacterium]|nr:BamA/TamA family outer membrane protein [Chitinophagaceae bacterium]
MNIFSVIIFISSCTFPRKFQKDKPFVYKTTIEVKGGNFTKEERNSLKQRLYSQLDDSIMVKTKDRWLVIHYTDHPPVFDTIAAYESARNMKASMLHIGYYFANVNYTADTVVVDDQQRVKVNFIVDVNKPTIIDTVTYAMYNDSLQYLVKESADETFLKEGDPITKENVLSEIERLVILFRKNGYYKFSADQLKVRGDTTIESLTNISDDPFEQLELLAEARQKDFNQIKLAVVLNQTKDSTKTRKYYINDITILPDYLPGDNFNDPSLNIDAPKSSRYTVKYHNYLFKRRFLSSNIFFRKGDFYNIENFNRTLNSFSKKGVWQSVNIDIVEVKDSINKINTIIQLIPSKKFGFETALEASYTDKNNSNNLSAGLFGISGNVSLLNRNLNKEGIHMTHALRAGIELNSRTTNAVNKIINSNELGYSNSLLFPKLITPFPIINNKRLLSKESFISTNLSLINRINLFNLRSANIAFGYNWSNYKRNNKSRQWIFKPLNIEFSYLYNKSRIFDSTLEANPFLRYSFNSALVAGAGLSYTSLYSNPRHRHSKARERSLKWNIEESGFLWKSINALQKYLREYVKADVEYKYIISYAKSAVAVRLFGGIGLAAKKDTSLPFFKQYFGGGSNSMRAWPVRGIGRGAQPIAPFEKNFFNDRTGDFQLEGNIEYRYNIAQIISNSLILKGAFFMDVGNVWNIRSSKTNGETDSAQFKVKNLYNELGVAIGTGFRLDFNYFVLRFDLGFRFKKPEVTENNGWRIPNINYKNVLSGNAENREWRHQNFNLTIGINYAF